MPAYKIPPKAASGVLTIDGQDVTCHMRRVNCAEGAASEQDVGTWCDPGATSSGAATRTLDVEWMNSFADGTDDGLYDILDGLADGTAKAVVFSPYPGGAAAPSWACNVVIPHAPLGEFVAESPVIVNTSWGVSGFAYTKAT